MFSAPVARNAHLVCTPAIKFKYSKKLKLWIRTSFSIERDKGGNLFFKQNNAFHEDRHAEARFWRPKPFSNVVEQA